MPQSFTFDPSYGPDFGLTDAAAPNDSGFLDPGTYSVSETVPAGWDLTSATCSDGSNPASINLAAGETVTCTFTNTQAWPHRGRQGHEPERRLAELRLHDDWRRLLGLQPDRRRRSEQPGSPARQLHGLRDRAFRLGSHERDL